MEGGRAVDFQAHPLVKLSTSWSAEPLRTYHQAVLAADPSTFTFLLVGLADAPETYEYTSLPSTCQFLIVLSMIDTEDYDQLCFRHRRLDKLGLRYYQFLSQTFD